MKLTFDNLDGLGPIDYSACLCADLVTNQVTNSAAHKKLPPLTIERTLNAPSRCSGTLLLTAAGSAIPGLPIPSRRARVVITAESGAVLFTGYVATEPQQVYAGVGTTGSVYRTVFSAVSDEWLLDRQQRIPGGAALQQFGASVLTTLTQRTGAGLLNTAGVTGGRKLGVFQPVATESWSTNAGTVAASTYAAYRAVNGALSLQPAGTVTHTLSDGDGTLQLAALQISSVKELANDVTVSGEIEPAAYITERFLGDGTTAVFQLAEAPFRPRQAGQAAHLLSDSFDQPLLNPQVWSVTDPGSRLSLSGLGLTLSGGNGSDGQTTLTAIDPVEVGGTLVVEAGSVRLSGASDGVLCGLYTGAVSRANCFAGYNIRQSGGTTLAIPFVNGAEVGTPLTVLPGHTYTLRLRLHCVETERVRQVYYTMVDGLVENFGGGSVAAPMSLVFEFQDLGLSSNTPATVLYDGTVASSPASCQFAAVDSVQLFGSLGYCRITQTGSAWINSTPPGSLPATRLIGVAGEGVDCTVNSAGLVTFLAGRIPVAGEIVTVTYRNSTRAVARLQDPASIAAEATGGAPGTAAWLGKVIRPAARSSADCEAAAQAILSFSTSRAAAIGGSYAALRTHLAATDDIWPGDLLQLHRDSQTTSVLVRSVKLEDGMSWPETIAYRVDFANDWAEALGLTLSEAIATDALLPPTAATAPGVFLPNLQQLQILASTAISLQLDAGTDPPAGGGFEVRRRDWDFGPSVDQDLVLRSPVRSFSIPREVQVERYYIRMYDASIPPMYSRLSSAVFTNLPVS